MKTSLEGDLSKVVHGDYTTFSSLLSRKDEILEELLSNELEFTVTADAVSRIVRALQRGELSPTQAQQWASFVRRGYISNPTGRPDNLSKPIKPLNIVYALEAEEQIATAISRLDEINDAIDGEISQSELTTILETLCIDNP